MGIRNLRRIRGKILRREGKVLLLGVIGDFMRPSSGPKALSGGKAAEEGR
jgi:hypothetical protein